MRIFIGEVIENLILLASSLDYNDSKPTDALAYPTLKQATRSVSFALASPKEKRSLTKLSPIITPISELTKNGDRFTLLTRWVYLGSSVSSLKCCKKIVGWVERSETQHVSRCWVWFLKRHFPQRWEPPHVSGSPTYGYYTILALTR